MNILKTIARQTTVYAKKMNKEIKPKFPKEIKGKVKVHPKRDHKGPEGG